MLRWWHKGQVNSAINLLSQLRDQSVVNDFMQETFGSNEKKEAMKYLSLENASAVLGHAVALINTKYSCYNKTGVYVLKNVFNTFQE